MRRTVRLAVLVVAFGLAAPALAAYVCHPDPPGTRTLSLQGQVAGYTVNDTMLRVAVRAAGTCKTLSWSSSDGSVAPSSVPCAAITSAPRPPAPANVRILRPAAGVDRPDRLAVIGASGATMRSWPLPVRVRPHTLQVSGDLASYSALGGNGLWVTRLTDGRTTFVAPVRAGDRPGMTARGVAYVDNVYKHASASRPILKFVPTSALAYELAQVGKPVHAGGLIRSFSMDGARIALVVSGGAQGCDRVVFWNVPWRSVEQVSQKAGVTCAALGASRRISEVALGGARAQWITTQNGHPIVVAADDIGCQEWVINRLSTGFSLGGITADGSMLAYSRVGVRRSSVGMVTGAYRSRPIYELGGAVRGMSADTNRVAVLAAGQVEVRKRNGGLVSSLRTPDATSLAMRGSTVVTTTGTGRLDVYASGTRVHRWPLPAGTQPHVDLQYGIAVVTTARSVYAVNISSGRTALIASAPSMPRAQIGSVGVAYTYGSTAKLIPMAGVEAAVR